jgi:hypothetical protein
MEKYFLQTKTTSPNARKCRNIKMTTTKVSYPIRASFSVANFYTLVTTKKGVANGVANGVPLLELELTKVRSGAM